MCDYNSRYREQHESEGRCANLLLWANPLYSQKRLKAAEVSVNHTKCTQANKHSSSKPVQTKWSNTETTKSKACGGKKTTDTARTEGTKTCHAAARGGKRRWKELSLAIDSSISWTTLREQILYLFDIVASLCAGFNEHDIQFLSSLLALLRGDLSAQVEAERGGRRTNRQMWKETQKRTGQKEREEVERETKRAQHRILFWVKKREREVSLVITHGHRGRQKGEKLLCRVKMKQQEKKNRISFIPQPHSDPYIMNTWRGY